MTGKNVNTIRWGIIGCGNVTEVKSGPAYQQVEGFQITAVMRRDLEKARDYAHRHGVPKYYNDAEKLIEDSEVDAVYIATPPDSHMFYALKVAEAGKVCCIEKPMSPSYEESLAIYTSFKKKKIPLFVAYYRRSLPRFNQVKSWLENNEIGEVRHLNWNLHQAPGSLDLSGADNWRTKSHVAPGGYFDDLASHGLDLFAFLLGDIKEASGMSLNQQGLYSAKDAVAACWIHDSGITGTGSWNFGCDQSLDRVEIFGSKGKISFSVFEDEPLLLQQGEEIKEMFIENDRHIQYAHVKNMKKQLLDQNFNHPSNGTSALQTSWVMDKILGSI
mgnify:FL=1